MRRKYVAGAGSLGIALILLFGILALAKWVSDLSRQYTLSIDSDRMVKVVVSVSQDAPYVTEEQRGMRLVFRNAGMDYWDVRVYDETGKETDSQIYDLSTQYRTVRIREHKLADN